MTKSNGLYYFDAYHPLEVKTATDTEKVVKFRPDRAMQFLWGWNGQLDKWVLSTNEDYSIVGDEEGDGDADGDHLDPNNYLISAKCLENRKDITADERTNNIFCISGYLPAYFDQINNQTQGAIWDYFELFGYALEQAALEKQLADEEKAANGEALFAQVLHAASAAAVGASVVAMSIS